MSNDSLTETEKLLREYADIIMSMADVIRKYPPAPGEDKYLSEIMAERLNYHGIKMSSEKFEQMVKAMEKI